MKPLRFSNEKKLRKQMHKRGWTDAMIREARTTVGIPTRGRLHPATRFVHPRTRQSVSVDDVTGEIFHVGEARFNYDYD